MIHSRKLIALVAVLSVALTACADKKTVGSAKVAVRLNGEVISAAELQNKVRQHAQIRDGQEVAVPRGR